MNQSLDSVDIDFVVVIPARYGSTRLPGKPLININGLPMILRVLRLVQQSGAKQIVVATDHPQIAEVVSTAGGEVCMTRADHASGTARLAEVVALKGWSAETLIVNVQGDEPLLPSLLIRQLAQQLVATSAPMATLATRLRSMSEFWDPNIVKVITDQQGQALYFSRAPIPWDRQSLSQYPLGSQCTLHQQPVIALLNHPCYQRHIGLYAYRAGFIQRYQQWPISPLEQLELLEQLRVLWHGEKIQVKTTSLEVPAGVDTPEDLVRVCQELSPFTSF